MTLEILGAMIGVLGLLVGLVLFTLADLRDRVIRLENFFLRPLHKEATQ